MDGQLDRHLGGQLHTSLLQIMKYKTCVILHFCIFFSELTALNYKVGTIKKSTEPFKVNALH